MTQPITQRSFIKGLDASTDKFDQPRNSLPRLSNLLLTRRGSLITCDGSSLIGFPLASNNAPVPSAGNGGIMSIFQYLSLTNNLNNGVILYLQHSTVADQLADPGGVVLTGVNVPGGTLTPGVTYSYFIQSLDGSAGFSGHSPGTSGPFSLLLPGGANAVQITFNVVWGAGSYAIYGRTGGAFNLLPSMPVLQPDFSQNSGGPIGGPTVTFTDPGGATSTLIANGNTTLGPIKLFSMSATPGSGQGYNAPVLIGKFPNFQSPDPVFGVSISGGILGATSAIARMIQFAGFAVITLGNSFRPQYTDGITVFPFTNTFTAAYVQWKASTTYLVGDVIQPLTPNGHIFKCIQGGQTNTVEPAWNTGNAQITIDNQVQWQENGFLATSPVPPGAAHAISHAGLLWILNTNPSNTADGISGPSSIQASDANNIISWNPLNQAFIGKDDGSDGMGLASFTIAELGISPLGSLVIFKDFSTYQIVGVFGAQDFTIQQIQSDMGCLAPKSIKFISGYGIVRFSHLGFALFDGIRDKLVSEQIRPFIFGSPSTGSPGLPSISPINMRQLGFIDSALINNPPMYACAVPIVGQAGLSRIFIYDLVLKAWTIIDLPSTTNPTSYILSMCQLRANETTPVTVVGGLDNGSIQQIQVGDSSWGFIGALSPIAVNWAFTTPEIFNTNDPSAEIYADSIMIRGTNLDGNPITVTLNIQTEAGTVSDPRTYNIGNGEFQIMVGVNEQALSFNATISGSGRVEIESVTWNVQPKPSGVPAILT